MKKKLWIFGIIAILVAAAVLLFLNTGGNVRGAVRLPSDSTLYAATDIEEATDLAIKAFSDGFKGCKLLNIGYDEAETLAETERRREQNDNAQWMVLTSDFYAGAKAEACFNPNSMYTNWKWILKNDGNGWQMVTWGYA